MELFTIQCTTCQARLKVKDESAIGDIVACPKCGSMVQIVPPVGWQRKEGSDSTAVAPRPSAVDTTPVSAKSAPTSKSAPKSASLSASSSSSKILPPSKTPPPTPAHNTPAESIQKPRKAAAAIPPALPPRHTPPAGASAGPGSSITLDGLAAKAASAAAISPAPPDASQVATNASAATNSTEPVPAELAPTTWWAATVDRIQADWPMLAGGLASGLLVGAVLWWALVPDSKPAAETVAMETVEVNDSTVATAADNAAGAEPTEVAPPPAESAPAVPVPDESKEGGDPVTEPATAEKEVAADSAATDATPAPPPASEAASDPVAAPAQAEAAASAPQPGIKLDPEAAPAPPATDSQPAAADSEPSAADDAQAPESPPATPGHSAGSPGEAREAHQLTAAEVDQRLTIELPKVKFRKVSLAQFVDFIGELTALPIAIDDEGLARAGHKRSVAVTVELSDTTARDALRAAVKPLGLTCVVRGGRLVVTSPAK